MTPGTRDLDLYRGDTYAHTVTFTDGTDPVDVSGYSWLAQIRETTDSAAVVEAFTVDTTNAATGVLVLRLSAAQAAELPRSARWDLQRTAGGVVETILAGRVVTMPDVSRVS